MKLTATLNSILKINLISNLDQRKILVRHTSDSSIEEIQDIHDFGLVLLKSYESNYKKNKEYELFKKKGPL